MYKPLQENRNLKVSKVKYTSKNCSDHLEPWDSKKEASNKDNISEISSNGKKFKILNVFRGIRQTVTSGTIVATIATFCAKRDTF